MIAGSSLGAIGLGTPNLARLEVRITTTSDWTDVLISPGIVLASHVVSAPPGVAVAKLSNGWNVRTPDTTSHEIVLSAVYEDTTRSSSTTVVVEKGSLGRTKAEITNTSSTPFPVASVVDTISGGGTNTLRTPLDSRVFFGPAAPKYVRPDPRRLVLAFYYPWWSQTEYQTLTTLIDRPLQPRGTYNLPSVYSMTQQAHANGIDGFIVSWAGEANNGLGFDAALKAGETAGTVTSAIFETARATASGNPSDPTDPAVVERWLRELSSRAGSPSFLRSGGVPVVFVYAMNRMAPASWASVLGDLAADGLPIRLVGDTPDLRYRNLVWGYYDYNPNRFTIEGLRSFNRGNAADMHLLTTPTKLYASTVSPGLDDHLIRDVNPLVPRGPAGERYAGTWSAALTEKSDWVLITSWNEWTEGTAVEPSVTYGDLALRQTAAYSAQFHLIVRLQIGAALQLFPAGSPGIKPAGSIGSLARTLAN